MRHLLISLIAVAFVIPAALAFDYTQTEMFNGHGPDVEIDLQGDLHMVWSDGRGVRYLKAEKLADGSFDFWPVESAIEVPGSGSASSYRYGFPKIAVDIDGGLHISWVNTNLNELFYAYYSEGSFLTSVKIKSSYPRYLGNTDIEVDTEKRAYIAYQNPKMGPPYGTGVICYRYGQGYIWDRMMTPLDSGEEKYPALAHNSYQPLGANNPLYLFWKEIHHFSKYDGLGWSPSQVVPGVPQYNGRVDMDVDPENKPVLCYLKWITGANWWIEGIYVQTCQDYGNTWNSGMKVSSANQVTFREDYSPVAPEVGVNANGDMVATWNDNGVFKYNVYENGIWLENEQTLGFANMHVVNGQASGSTNDIVAFNENQAARMFFTHFQFNQAPYVQLAGYTLRQFSADGFDLGGDRNMLAIVTDNNGQEDIESVTAYDPDTLLPVFELYDDGAHGDYLAGDSIYGATLGDEYYQPGDRQLYGLQAVDRDGSASDLWPFLVIHGGSAASAGSEFEKDIILPSWGDDHHRTMVDSFGEWSIYMGGYMQTYLTVGADKYLDIVFWVVPTNPPAQAGLDRIDVYYDGTLVELPLYDLGISPGPDWGHFYGISIPIPGDSLEGFDNVALMLDFQPVDTNGNAGPMWPYLEFVDEPTPTPEPTATPTTRPTMPPFDTPTPTPTDRPTMPPFDTPTPTPTDTPTLIP